MRLAIMLFLLISTLQAQEVKSAKETLIKEQMEINKKLFESNVDKNFIDASNIKALQEIEINPIQKEKDFKLSVKKEMLQKDLEIEQQQQQLKSIINANQENGNKPLTIPEGKAITESDIELNTKRLYGPSQFDSRIELLELNPDINWQYKLLLNSESVAMVVEKEKLSQLAKELYLLDTSKTLGKSYGLCKDEAFYNQPIAGIGTAFIISENTMITANHVFERPLANYIVIFGYKILVAKTGVTDYYFDKKDIYFPKSISKRNDELDIVEFTVDRNFERPILEWENSSKLAIQNSEIYMMGYPSGLPIKVALNAAIEDGDHPYYYYTSLDSFQGNSGSPVFNFYTNKVIGILVSGEIDYKFNGNCYYSPVCKIPYCKGEKVIRIERFME
jgi:V8-like Glu-specific endopeptidase